MQSKKNILWNAFGNILYLGCQWLVTVLVTRLFGYEDAGVLSLAMSISATFQTVALFGIRNYQVSDIEDKYSDSTYVGFRGICCFTALILCMMFSFVNSYDSNQMWAIFWFMMYRLAENYSDVLHGIAQKNNRLDIAGKAFAIKGLETIIFFLLGYYLFKNLVVAITIMAMGSWVTTWAYDYVCIKKMSDIHLTDKLKNCFLLGKETVPLCIYMFLLSAISTVPKYILEKMCDATALGAYSSIYAPALLIQAAAGYIYSPFATQFAEYYTSKEVCNFKKMFKQLSVVILGVAIVILIGGSVLGEWVLQLLFGPGIIAYIELLLPILFSTFATAYLAFLCMLQIVIRDFKGLICGCLCGVLLCCILTPLAINMFGINGASYGLLGGSCGAIGILAVKIFVWMKGVEKSED